MAKTALITGASAGIGAVFARRLAGEGVDLTLVARRAQRLDALADELRAQHGIQVAVVPADLARPEDVARLDEVVQRSPGLDFLVNNAGFGTQGTFVASDVQEQLDMVHVHVSAAVRLCRAALPRMIARKTGTIINVSSIAGFIPVAGKATYNASKSFLTTFSQVLQEEVRQHGVRIQALCPGFTYTEFHDTPAYGDFDRGTVPRWLWMTAEQVVDDSLSALASNRVVVIPGFKNRLIVRAVRFRITAALIQFLRRRVMKRWRT